VYAGELDETYVGLEVLVTVGGRPVSGVLTEVVRCPPQAAVDIAVAVASRLGEVLGAPDLAVEAREEARSQQHVHITVAAERLSVDLEQPVVTTAPSAALEPLDL